ncbi:putative membrane protein [Paenibacillus castaneae]|uniref:PH domain-containing protein n=1 Tax=Paenibacillus castaneae TaxID=474957 RepID=UPI00141BA071|nr:PH domain-containing protein [Paenibacillus castaneae]NIK80508.1 putative membrane protein [Paenibacillus castaneae]
MSERHSLHPLYILFGLLNTIRGFVPFILIGILKGTNWTHLNGYWYVGAAVLALIILVLSFLEWKRFGFWLEEDRIIIRKGLWFRDEKTIFYVRIHSVNVEQPLIQRLLGVAQVKIETPGGNKKADGILPALSLKEANHLQLMLKGQAKAAEHIAPEYEPDSEIEKATIPSDNPITIKELKPFSSANSKPRAEMDGAAFQLSPLQLLQAAATSMNFGLVAAFMAGLYSLADDILNLLLPDHFFESVVKDSANLMPSYIILVILIFLGIGLAWILSIVLYILKYAGFTVKREDRQISVAYGLLEKKTFVFDPKKVQAVIINEGLLRQAFGYVEIQLQVISSDKKEQLILHPFIKRTSVSALLADFVPQVRLPDYSDLIGAPKRAFLYYIRIELLLTLAVSVTLILWLKANGLWSMLLIPLVVWWRRSCYKAAGARLEAGQLTLRRRFISRSTYLIRRPQMVMMRVKRSNSQQRKKLLSLSVRVMGSQLDYRVKCLDRADVDPIWQWYSRNK